MTLDTNNDNRNEDEATSPVEVEGADRATATATAATLPPESESGLTAPAPGTAMGVSSTLPRNDNNYRPAVDSAPGVRPRDSLAVRLARIARMRLQLNGRKKKATNALIDLQKATIQTQQTVIQTQQTTLQTQQTVIQSLQETIQSLQATVQTQKSTVQTQKSTVQTQQAVIQKQEPVIKSLQATVQTQQFVLQDQRAEIKQQRPLIERFQMWGASVSEATSARLSTMSIPGSGEMPTTSSSNYQTSLLNITNLPDETLEAVAKFLPKPSRALFAVAMTDPTLFLHKSKWELVSSAATNRAILSVRSSNDDEEEGDDEEEDKNYVVEEMVKDKENSDEDSNYNSDSEGDAIYDDDYFYYDDEIEDDEVDHDGEDDDEWEEEDDEGWVEDEGEEKAEDEDDEDDVAPDDESWATLDFEEIEKSLAAKLSDDDIRGVLICIDGVHRLETISLCGCVGITGSGLDPLMGSIVLRNIDLSLVKRTENPVHAPYPNLSRESVIPIFKSIIDAPGSSLKYVLIPYISDISSLGYV